LDAGERQRLAADFAHELVLRHGCAVDVAIHRPGQAAATSATTTPTSC
jgi:hypothetical protein